MSDPSLYVMLFLATTSGLFWFVAAWYIQDLRAAIKEVDVKQDRLDEIQKASKSYIESVNTEQEAIWRSIERIERRLKKQEAGESHV